MTEEGFKRKLTAILSADVKDYSRLMEDDEAETVRTLNTYRTAMSDLIQQYRGRVVDATGDNIMAEFTSVVDAVNCAVEIQRDLAERNAELTYERRMEFRIGVNLGDVIDEDGRIYGDGVNIAARVENLAEPGGICISGRAYDQVANKLGLEYENLGEHQVKNISTPIRIYRVLSFPGAAAHRVVKAKEAMVKKWRKITLAAAAALVIVAAAAVVWNYYLRPSPMEPASVEKMAYPLSDKPSIAVLPFNNLSGSQSDEYIADGLSENIISSLSKIPDMLVIARNSTFVYKGKPVKIKQVAEELGVRYVLEGSIQKSGQNLRVTAQLVDAIKGHHLWSERYDRDTEDFFAVQDDITRNIVIALQVELTEGEQARIWHTTENLEAWGYATKGIALFQHYTKEKNARSRELFKQAVELDPNYAFAWISIAWTHLLDFRYGWGDSRAESLKTGIEIVKKASALDDTQSEVHSFWNVAYLFQRQYEKAIAEGKQAVALGPSDATSHILLSMALHFAGNFEESIFHANKAMRLSPYYPTWYLKYLAMSYCMAGAYEKAIAPLKKAIERAKVERGQLVPPHIHLVHTFVGLGQIEEAKALADTVLKLDPNFSLGNWQKSLFYKDPADLDRHLNALRKAGLPEHPPPHPLPDKPSIAVLPFDNISGDPEQEYFSNGMTDDLITDLSKISGLFVIARNSTFQYKGKAVDVKKVSRELGVRYVLEGSVRKAKERVRINAQLIDATTGGHLWADRYDGKLDDIFALQDKINQKIVTALAVKLTADEQKTFASKGTNNIEAYDAFLKGWQHYQRRTPPEELAKAIPYFERAIELDNNYGRAYAALALTYWYGARGGGLFRVKKLGLSWFGLHKQAVKYLELAMKNPTSLAYQVSSERLLVWRQYEEAISHAEKAIALDPNDPGCNYTIGRILARAGRPKEA
ncbi:MAG: adenylate/guanylate cyclase domain-containing protein, partial [Planctomycetota bacterium]